jgi:hypothetical protein
MLLFLSMIFGLIACCWQRNNELLRRSQLEVVELWGTILADKPPGREKSGNERSRASTATGTLEATSLGPFGFAVAESRLNLKATCRRS